MTEGALHWLLLDFCNKLDLTFKVNILLKLLGFSRLEGKIGFITFIESINLSHLRWILCFKLLICTS